jgi:hypothetical protein
MSASLSQAASASVAVAAPNRKMVGDRSVKRGRVPSPQSEGRPLRTTYITLERLIAGGLHGATGAAGAKGDPGPATPPRASRVYSPGVIVPLPATLQDLTIPANTSVMVIGRATLTSQQANTTQDFAACNIGWAGEGDLDTTSVALGVDAGEVAFVAVSLSAIAENDTGAPKVLTLDCFSSGAAARANDTSLTAVEVTPVPPIQ